MAGAALNNSWESSLGADVHSGPRSLMNELTLMERIDSDDLAVTMPHLALVGRLNKKECLYFIRGIMRVKKSTPEAQGSCFHPQFK